MTYYEYSIGTHYDKKKRPVSKYMERLLSQVTASKIIEDPIAKIKGSDVCGPRQADWEKGYFNYNRKYNIILRYDQHDKINGFLSFYFLDDAGHISSEVEEHIYINIVCGRGMPLSFYKWVYDEGTVSKLSLTPFRGVDADGKDIGLQALYENHKLVMQPSDAKCNEHPCLLVRELAKAVSNRTTVNDFQIQISKSFKAAHKNVTKTTSEHPLYKTFFVDSKVNNNIKHLIFVNNNGSISFKFIRLEAASIEEDVLFYVDDDGDTVSINILDINGKDPFQLFRAFSTFLTAHQYKNKLYVVPKTDKESEFFKKHPFHFGPFDCSKNQDITTDFCRMSGSREDVYEYIKSKMHLKGGATAKSRKTTPRTKKTRKTGF